MGGNWNEFSQLVKDYTEKRTKRMEEIEKKRIVIDISPEAVLGNMLLTKPADEEEKNDYVAALITSIAELLADDYNVDVEDLGLYLVTKLCDNLFELNMAFGGFGD